MGEKCFMADVLCRLKATLSRRHSILREIDIVANERILTFFACTIPAPEVSSRSMKRLT